MAYSSKVANLLLYTPFDFKSVVPKEIFSKLTKKEFLKYCYSPPEFEQEIERLEDIENVENFDCKTKMKEKDTQKNIEEIIETCKSYAEGHKKIMRVYTAVYMR